MAKCKTEIPYEDIEIVKNSGDIETHWTVEINTKLTKKQAEELAEMIYNLDFNK